MATWDDVSRLALALPEAVEVTDTNGLRWDVRRKYNYFAWERPIRAVDRARRGDALPEGPILGVCVASVDDKRGLMGSDPDVFFTLNSDPDYPAVLVLIERISIEQLGEVLTDSWLCRAPRRLATQFLAEHPTLGGEA